jgi:hypothetical protein
MARLVELHVDDDSERVLRAAGWRPERHAARLVEDSSHLYSFLASLEGVGVLVPGAASPTTGTVVFSRRTFESTEDEAVFAAWFGEPVAIVADSVDTGEICVGASGAWYAECRGAPRQIGVDARSAFRALLIDGFFRSTRDVSGS